MRVYGTSGCIEVGVSQVRVVVPLVWNSNFPQTNEWEGTSSYQFSIQEPVDIDGTTLAS